MRAARRFLTGIDGLQSVAQINVGLYGSLALTGRGHCTDRAILLGLEGAEPDTVDAEAIEPTLRRISDSQRIRLLGTHEIDFSPERDLQLHFQESLPQHPNGMRFEAADANGQILAEQEFFSIGGGFVLRGDEMQGDAESSESSRVPFPFDSASELLQRCDRAGLRIDQAVWKNERTWRKDDEIRASLMRIWQVMSDCIDRGLNAKGVLPGELGVSRRAPKYATETDLPIDHVNAFAFAVNEENAAGGRVVTAPTNGAAGIVPAVLRYYLEFVEDADEEGLAKFLLTAGAIAILYKKNASISGAEMGCQGEVGVACSMAAGGLAAAQGGNNVQIENAAEIGMEHNLGLTCDPVGGLVQIPCIERNAMGAVKAINATRMALRGDGRHKVTLDQVIATMRQTGRDMSSIYKETSKGGLAVNVIEC